MQTLDFPTALFSKKQWLLSELQSAGLRVGQADATTPSRSGGAGPTDHKAVTVLGTTIMVPIHTRGAASSPFSTGPVTDNGQAALCRDGEQIASIQFPPEPKFYGLNTAEGVPYWKIAQLHSARVLAAAEFIELSRTALTEASERVRQKFGFSCTAASASLHYIERWAGALPPDTPVTILHIS